MEGLYFYMQPNRGLMRRPGGARDDKPSSQSASPGEATLSSHVSQVENMKTRCSVYLWRISAFHQELPNEGNPFPPGLFYGPAAALIAKEKRIPSNKWTSVDSEPVWEGLQGLGSVY